ncbi:MAG: ferritin-like domain-containing protein [Candidatus Micrarchaeota archaeon]
MGSTGARIVGMDVKELIALLNKALADEWLAYYQYWAGAKLARGPMRPDVEKELKEHAEEEFKHANMLADRIIILGGQPLLDPAEFQKHTNCGYDAPKDPNVVALLKQNIHGEQCAIGVYNKILEKVKLGNDPITFNMIRKIMEDEVQHEEEIENLLEDIGNLK